MVAMMNDSAKTMLIALLAALGGGGGTYLAVRPDASQPCATCPDGQCDCVTCPGGVCPGPSRPVYLYLGEQDGWHEYYVIAARQVSGVLRINGGQFQYLVADGDGWRVAMDVKPTAPPRRVKPQGGTGGSGASP